MLFETPLRFLDDASHGLLKKDAVGFVEGSEFSAVNVEDGTYVSMDIADRNDNFTV